MGAEGKNLRGLHPKEPKVRKKIKIRLIYLNKKFLLILYHLEAFRHSNLDFHNSTQQI